jgi:hypothetical protein
MQLSNTAACVFICLSDSMITWTVTWKSLCIVWNDSHSIEPQGKNMTLKHALDIYVLMYVETHRI